MKNAPIVILGETTAFTDSKNEEKLQQSIDTFITGKTLLVIAHRFYSIKDSDKIVVLKDGQIDSFGKHDELLREEGLYREMWDTHIGAKNWSAGSKERRAL